MAGPNRADLAGGNVANRDDDIHFRDIGTILRAELLPALAAQAGSRAPQALEQGQGMGIDVTLRITARAVAQKPPRAVTFDQALGHDAAA